MKKSLSSKCLNQSSNDLTVPHLSEKLQTRLSKFGKRQLFTMLGLLFVLHCQMIIEAIVGDQLNFTLLLLEIAFLINIIIFLFIQKFWIKTQQQLVLINIAVILVNILIFVPVFMLVNKTEETTRKNIKVIYCYFVFHYFGINSSMQLKNFKFRFCFFPFSQLAFFCIVLTLIKDQKCQLICFIVVSFIGICLLYLILQIYLKTIDEFQKEYLDEQIQIQKNWKMLLKNLPVAVFILNYETFDLTYENYKFKEIIHQEKQSASFSQINQLFCQLQKISFTKKSKKKVNYKKKIYSLLNILNMIKENESKTNQKQTIVCRTQIKTNVERQSFDSTIQNSGTGKDDQRELEIKIQPIIFNYSQAFLILVDDITEQIKFQDLQENNEFKNRIISSISHELLTPLNSCIPLIEASIQEPLEANQKKEFLTIALREIQLLESFSKSFRDLSQMIAGQFQLQITKFELNYLINEVNSIVQCLIKQKEGIQYQILIDDKIKPACYIQTDRDRLKIIMLNLLTNAIKFTERGTITFQLEVQNWDFRGPNTFFFSVIDTGIGMDNKQIHKLNKLLSHHSLSQMTTINSTSTCLGLLISQNLLLKLGSQRKSGIIFSSKKNSGSTFGFQVTNLAKSQSSSNVSFSGSSFSLAASFQPPFKKFGTLNAEQILKQDQLISIFEHVNTENELNYPQKKQKSVFNQIKQQKQSNQQLFSSGDFSSSFSETNNIQTINNYNLITQNKSSKVAMEKLGQENQQIYALIVDDDAINLLALSLLLQKHQINSIKAFNGQEAIDIMQQNYSSYFPKEIKIIFMDYQMPIMDGIQATKILREMMNNKMIPQIPIIACTAFNSKTAMSECLNVGISDFAHKPINSQKIGLMISKWIFRHQSLRSFS